MVPLGSNGLKANDVQTAIILIQRVIWTLLLPIGIWKNIVNFIRNIKIVYVWMNWIIIRKYNDNIQMNLNYKKKLLFPIEGVAR